MFKIIGFYYTEGKKIGTKLFLQNQWTLIQRPYIYIYILL